MSRSSSAGSACFGLGVGLMTLVFYSDRKGFDERAGNSPLSDGPTGPEWKPGRRADMIGRQLRKEVA